MKKIKKSDIIASTIIVIVIMITIIIISFWPVIFQKGNPIPYVKAILQLNSNQTYVQVQENKSNIYITKRDKSDEFIEYVEMKYEVSFQEQLGSGYIFSFNGKEVLASSEIYLKYYKVWNLNVEGR